DSNPRGRARRSRPCGDSGDGRGGARRGEEPCKARRQAAVSASEVAGGAASHPTGKAHRSDAFEKRPDEWPPPRAARGAEGREDERAAGPHKRSPRPDERLDEWAWANKRSHERLGADERTDERTRTNERAHERPGSDQRPHQRLGPDQRVDERPRTHERSDERAWGAPADRFSRRGASRRDAQRRVEA